MVWEGFSREADPYPDLCGATRGNSIIQLLTVLYHVPDSLRDDTIHLTLEFGRFGGHLRKSACVRG